MLILPNSCPPIRMTLQKLWLIRSGNVLPIIYCPIVLILVCLFFCSYLQICRPVWSSSGLAYDLQGSRCSPFINGLLYNYIVKRDYLNYSYLSINLSRFGLFRFLTILCKLYKWLSVKMEDQRVLKYKDPPIRWDITFSH